MYIELSSFEKISFNCSRPQGPLQAYGLKTSFSKPHPLHTTLVERVELRTFGIQSSNPSSYGVVSWPLQFGDQYGQSLRSDRLSRCQWEGLHQLLKEGNVMMLILILSFHSVSRHQQSSKESQECGANSSSFPGTELSLTQEDLRLRPKKNHSRSSHTQKYHQLSQINPFSTCPRNIGKISHG